MLKKIVTVAAISLLSVGTLAGCTSEPPKVVDKTEKIDEKPLNPNPTEEYSFTVSSVAGEPKSDELPYTEVIEKDKLYISYGGSGSCAPEISGVGYEKGGDSVAVYVHPYGTKLHQQCTMDLQVYGFSVQADNKDFDFNGKKIEFVTIAAEEGSLDKPQVQPVPGETLEES